MVEHTRNKQDDALHNKTIEMKALVEAEGGDEEHSGENSAFNAPSIGEASTTRSSLQLANRLLYTSHAFAQFSEVSWQFCVTLFLAASTGYQSLILVSIYGLFNNLTVFLAGGTFGKWLDDSENRLTTARKLICLENSVIVLGTIACYILLSHANDSNPRNSSSETFEEEESWLRNRFENVPSTFWSICSLIGVLVCGAFAEILDKTFLVAIERDWIVTISRSAAVSDLQTNLFDGSTFSERSRIRLSEMNVILKQIDLACKVAAPGISGLILHILATGTKESDEGTKPNSQDLRLACIFVGCLNILSLVVEYICTARVYHLVPDLARKRTPEEYDKINDSVNTVPSDSSGEENATEAKNSCVVLSSLVTYLEVPVSRAGIALAFLFANALTFGNGVMSAYLSYNGMQLDRVGVFRGIASVIGLTGTFVYHFSARYFSLETTGMWSVTYQFSCVALVWLSTIAGDMIGEELALPVMIAGICLSRIGLWVFDIAVTQLQQEEVPEGIRGLFGGVQQALNAFFTMLSFTLGIAFPNPRDFQYFALASVLSVGSAMILFAVCIYVPRRIL